MLMDGGQPGGGGGWAQVELTDTLLVEGGDLQHFQHYTTNKFDLYAYRHKHMKLFIDIVMKRIYLFDIVA